MPEAANGERPGFREYFAAARAFFWSAIIFGVLALGALVVELQSPDLVIWTGHCVPASFQDGLAYFHAEGRLIVVGDPSLPDQPPRMVTVCYHPGNPDAGYIVHPAAYWVEGTLIAAPFILAVTLLVTGVVLSVRRIRATPEALPPLPRWQDT